MPQILMWSPLTIFGIESGFYKYVDLGKHDGSVWKICLCACKYGGEVCMFKATISSYMSPYSLAS